MLSRLLKRVHTPIFGFLLIFSDLFCILIVLLARLDNYLYIIFRVSSSVTLGLNNELHKIVSQ